MNGIDKYKLVGFDSNIFIYHFERHPKFFSATLPLFEKLVQNKLRGITSIITVIEILSYPLPKPLLKEIQEEFRRLPNLTILELNSDIALDAARIRREYKFKLPDAVQLATAKQAKVKAFVTNDASLKHFKELKILLLSEV